MDPGRRQLLRTALAALLGASGCGSPPPAPVRTAPPAVRPLKKVAALTDLLALANLRWLILARPREIASVAFLIPSIGTVVPEENFTHFAASTAIDLRQATEAAIAAYTPAEGAEEVIFYLVRHAGEPLRIERAFRERLTSDERRSVDRPDLVRVSGKVAMTRQALVVIGPDVVGYQHGGSMGRGPARVAALYASEKLTRSPTVLSQDPLRGLARRFGPAPARAFALGPFEGELARGARGLLAGATAIGAVARPSAREGLALVVAVAGDFSTSGAPASEELLAAWTDVASGSFGHLLGLDQPVDPPLVTHAPDAVTVAVEVHPDKLAEGLARATSADIARIMR